MAGGGELGEEEEEDSDWSGCLFACAPNRKCCASNNFLICKAVQFKGGHEEETRTARKVHYHDVHRCRRRRSSWVVCRILLTRMISQSPCICGCLCAGGE